MKNLLFISLFFMVFSCQNSNKKNQVAEKNINLTFEISKSREWVDSFHDEDFKNRSDIRFTTVATTPIDLNNNSTIDSIKLSNCLGWNNEPGDFRKIRFVIDDQKSFQLKSYGSWIKVPERFNSGQYYFSNYLKLNIGYQKQVIIFIGYSYASNPGFLTIISFDDNEPMIIFNKKYWLDKIVDDDSNYYYLIVKDYQNKKYKLYAKNGDIKLESYN